MPDVEPDVAKLIETVPALIKASRADFARLFDAEALSRDKDNFVPLHVLVQMQRMLDGRGAETGTDLYAFKLAFWHAHQHGWAKYLFAKVVMAQLVTIPSDPSALSDADKKTYSDIGQLGSPNGGGMEIELQARVNDKDGYLDPLSFAREMQLATRRICQVIVDRGVAKGTGFLVGAQTVLTNWHVVKLLFDQGAVDGELKDVSGRLKVLFDYVKVEQAGGGASFGGTTVVARSIDISNAAYPQEYAGEEIGTGQNLLAAGASEKLDFALIRLDGAPGLERGWYTLLPDLWPVQDSSVYVAQYPRQNALKVSSGLFAELRDQRSRVRHLANAEAGSSGGLCLGFDMETRSLKPSAMHQAGVKILPVAGAASAGGEAQPIIVNQAVPLAKIAPLVASLALRVDDVSPILRLGAASGPDHVGAPVFGRVAFQKYVAEAVKGDARIIVVRPQVQPGQSTARLGKSFSEVLLKSLLAPDANVVVTFQADEISTDATALAADIMKRIAPAATNGQTWTASATASTTETAWIEDFLIDRDFSPRLASAGRGRLVWLVIDKLDVVDLPDAGGRRFLDALYQNIRTLPSVRILLIGLTRDLPSMDQSIVRVDRLERPPGEGEISSWLTRRFGLGRPVDPPILKMLVKVILTGSGPAGTTATVAEIVKNQFDPNMPAEIGIDEKEGA